MRDLAVDLFWCGLVFAALVWSYNKDKALYAAQQKALTEKVGNDSPGTDYGPTAKQMKKSREWDDHDLSRIGCPPRYQDEPEAFLLDHPLYLDHIRNIA